MTVAAVVLYYRHWPGILTTIERLSDEPLVDHLILVDNCSQDGAAARLHDAFPQTEIIMTDRNMGYAGGMNVGLARAQELGVDTTILLTHETVLLDGALQGLIDLLDARPGVVLAGPVLEDPRTGRVFSWGGALTTRGLPEHLPSPLLEGTPYSVSWLDGACLAVRNAFIAQHEILFSEDYFLYCEDVQFGHDVTRLGGQILIDPRCRALQQTNGMPPYYAARNTPRVVYRVTGSRRLAAYSITMQMSQALRDCLRGRSASGRARLRGVRDLARGRTGPSRS